MRRGWMAAGVMMVVATAAAGLQHISQDQPDPADFRELQRFFPDLDGWTRGKPAERPAGRSGMPAARPDAAATSPRRS
jgi:hypothetical protein